MKDGLLISLSIVSHGDSEKVLHLLDSLQKREHDAKRFQILLTDNFKNELPDFDPAPWASLRIIRNERRLGFAENHNRAFKLAEGKYFAVLNPDLVFEEAVFEKLTARINSRQADIIAPQIVDAHNVRQDSFRSLPTPLGLVKRRLFGGQIEIFPADARGLIHPGWIAGMFLLMETETYRRLNGLDEKFFLYFEDVDFCSRARLRGMKITVDANIRVRHEARRASRVKTAYLLLHTLSAIRFFLSPVYRQSRRL